MRDLTANTINQNINKFSVFMKPKHIRPLLIFAHVTMWCRQWGTFPKCIFEMYQNYVDEFYMTLPRIMHICLTTLTAHDRSGMYSTGHKNITCPTKGWYLSLSTVDPSHNISGLFKEVYELFCLKQNDTTRRFHNLKVVSVDQDKEPPILLLLISPWD